MNPHRSPSSNLVPPAANEDMVRLPCFWLRVPLKHFFLFECFFVSFLLWGCENPTCFTFFTTPVVGTKRPLDRALLTEGPSDDGD